MLVVIWWQAGLAMSTSVFFFANQVNNIYRMLIQELKPYLNIEEPCVGNIKENFCFFILLNLMLALTVLSAVF